MFFELEVKGGGVGAGAYLSLNLSAMEVGWGVGAYSRLGAF